MAVLSSPVVGSAQTGLTSPTYSLTIDGAPPHNAAVQYVVSAIGGTQTGVEANTIGQPFSITIERPKTYKLLPPLSAMGVLLGSVPKNTHVVRVRKGALVSADSSRVEINRMVIQLEIAAGSETADPLSVRAMISAAIGALTQYSDGLGTQVTTGILGTA